VTVTINGTNDVPTIGGTIIGSVTEDNLAVAIGTLTSTDTIRREQRVTAAGGAGANGYGTYAVDASGHWTLHAQQRRAGGAGAGATGTLTDTFVVASGDGSQTQTVTVTIHGTNDVPVISGVVTGAVTEGHPATASGR